MNNIKRKILIKLLNFMKKKKNIISKRNIVLFKYGKMLYRKKDYDKAIELCKYVSEKTTDFERRLTAFGIIE